MYWYKKNVLIIKMYLRKILRTACFIKWFNLDCIMTLKYLLQNRCKIKLGIEFQKNSKEKFY